MSSDDNSEAVKTGGAIVGELIKAAADEPNVKQAGGELGKAVLTVAKAVNNSLMPIAAVNFAFAKAKEYYSYHFQSDIEKKLKVIPPESLIEPKASIAGPALQGLAFSHDEENLREMYLNLLASAMNKGTAPQAHPAFVEIIKQLSSAEIILLGLILKLTSGTPLVEIRKASKSKFSVVYRNLINVIEPGTNNMKEDPAVSYYIDNWVRLGLVYTGFDKIVDGYEAYKWIEDRPECKRAKLENEDEEFSISYERGYIERTSLGTQFAKSVGIIT